MVRAQSSGSLSHTLTHRADVSGVVDHHVYRAEVSQRGAHRILHLGRIRKRRR